MKLSKDLFKIVLIHLCNPHIEIYILVLVLEFSSHLFAFLL